MIRDRGILTVIYGPMLAGKSTQLVNELEHWARYHTILAITHIKHTRGVSGVITSRRGRHWPCERLEDLSSVRNMLVILLDINDHAKPAMMVIDEIQFFEPKAALAIIEQCLSNHVDVIACGLRFDWKREPFAITAELIKKANYLTEFRAPCGQCGAATQHTKRLDEDTADEAERIAPGKKYETRCVGCWEVGNGS